MVQDHTGTEEESTGAEVQPESGPVQVEGIEGIEPELLQQILSLKGDEVIVPLRMQREDVTKIKAVKLSDAERIKVAKFQSYLHDRGYLPDNTFASLFVYLYNLAFTLHKRIADEEERREAVEG